MTSKTLVRLTTFLLQVFCMCPDGFLLGSDWATCEDVDECENDKMECDQLCINTPGSYQVNKTSRGFTSIGLLQYSADRERDTPSGVLS